MKRSTFLMEKRKYTISTCLRARPKPKDENIHKYNELNRDINKLIRTINMQFDFKNFKKEKLVSLEKVSILFLNKIYIIIKIVFFSIKRYSL